MIAISGEEAVGRFDDGGLAAGADVGIDFAIAAGLALGVEGDVAKSLSMAFGASAFGRRGEVNGTAGIGDEAEEAGVVFLFIKVFAEDLFPLAGAFTAGDADAVAVFAGVVGTGEPVGEDGAVWADGDGGKVGPVDEPAFAAGDFFGGGPTLAGPFSELQGVAFGAEGVDSGEVDCAVGAGGEVGHAAFWADGRSARIGSPERTSDQQDEHSHF